MFPDFSLNVPLTASRSMLLPVGEKAGQEQEAQPGSILFSSSPPLVSEATAGESTPPSSPGQQAEELRQYAPAEAGAGPPVPPPKGVPEWALSR
eukprot:8074154-Pyramimonas_sp.AAC.2